eukprot:XP_011670807.1 PREDICTED: alpha-(1,6)-fucosyltransferase-like isoform X1 [Strongylocentrotus purpuratus]
MNTLFKLLVTITLALIISLFVIFDKETSPRFNQDIKSSKQDSPRTEINSVGRLYMNLTKHDEEQKHIVSGNNTLRQVDGHSSWKQDELKKLSNVIQQRLYFLQNPPDCTKAKKILCTFKKTSGFGSKVHHVSFCMLMAYGSGRTLVLESGEGWHYSKEGWEKFFRPLSDTCLDGTGETTSYNKWPTPDGNKSIQVVELPIVGTFVKTNKKPVFLPWAIPEDISKRLRRVHSKPHVWWIGQIMTYILKPQPQAQEFIDKKINALEFTRPIVGIHVRRTDKLIREAKFHGIEEYMDQVEKYYQKLEKRKKVSVRKVFLATDTVGLLDEAQKKYPGYVFISDANISMSADVSLRLSEESLMGIIVDLHLLARSDFLVCTCSSNICRLAYEMMQRSNVDVSKKLHCLDRRYYWHGENIKHKTAKMPVYEGAENVHLYGV